MNIIRFSLLAALSLAGSIASPAESQAQGIANPGLEEGAPTPTGWRFAPARQYAVALDSVDAKEGRWAARVTGQPGGPANEFGSVSQRLEGAPLRNKRVRYRAWVRTDLAPGASFSGLWFRVDRPNGGRGFFDNMGARPIRGRTGWQEYEITGTVAPRSDINAYDLTISFGGPPCVIPPGFPFTGVAHLSGGQLLAAVRNTALQQAIVFAGAR